MSVYLLILSKHLIAYRFICCRLQSNLHLDNMGSNQREMLFDVFQVFIQWADIACTDRPLNQIVYWKQRYTMTVLNLRLTSTRIRDDMDWRAPMECCGTCAMWVRFEKQLRRDVGRKHLAP